MKLYQRFAYYLIGLVMGLFFVAAIWSGKDVSCSYFPNARVLSDLRNKPFHFSASADSTFAAGWISKNDIKIILTRGDVDFDKSNIPFKGGKFYVVEGQTVKGEEVFLEVVNYTDKALLHRIRKAGSKN